MPRRGNSQPSRRASKLSKVDEPSMKRCLDSSYLNQRVSPCVRQQIADLGCGRSANLEFGPRYGAVDSEPHNCTRAAFLCPKNSAYASLCTRHCARLLDDKMEGGIDIYSYSYQYILRFDGNLVVSLWIPCQVWGSSIEEHKKLVPPVFLEEK